MGWHDGSFGGGGFGGGGHPGPEWGGFLLLGPLLWLLTPLVIAGIYLWLRNRQRPALAGQPHLQGDALVGDDPSAFELLRRRYVLGEIDAPAFEAMTERLLISERAEQLSPPAIRSARYDRYLRRDQAGQPDDMDDVTLPMDASDITWV